MTLGTAAISLGVDCLVSPGPFGTREIEMDSPLERCFAQYFDVHGEQLYVHVLAYTVRD